MPLLVPNSADIAISQPSFGSHICTSRAQLLVHDRTLRKITFRKDKKLSSTWKVSIPRKVSLNAGHLNMHDAQLIKAVSTLEQKPLTENADEVHVSHKFFFDTESPKRIQPSSETSLDLDEKEKLRRMRISNANKGNVPWNKGRKHSAETLQRIRERTKLAMQDPKVKMKLVNLGHAQSEETRMKIGVGVRMGWQRRREKLMLQENCRFEWQNLIAEASRRGYSGEDELQWDSYKILDKQLEQEWLESIEQRKTMPRPKGHKRAPKSPEQRRKISEAISAKWNDPGYRERVCSALEKYHGTPVGSKKRPPRRKPSDDSQESPPKRKVKLASYDYGRQRKSQTRSRKKRAAPKYKDPLADSKLEMIKNIKAQRMAMETKKTEAMDRARLLITEAEKAAEALEEAALNSPLARASLIETRKLIAEATRSIEAVESGQVTSYEKGSFSSSKSNDPVNHHGEKTDGGDDDHILPSMKKVNGTPVPLLGSNEVKDLDFGKTTAEELTNHGQHEETRHDRYYSSGFQLNSLINQVQQEDQKLSPFKPDGATRDELTRLPDDERVGHLYSEASQTPARQNPTKKWLNGRLVEVSDSEDNQTVDQEQ